MKHFLISTSQTLCPTTLKSSVVNIFTKTNWLKKNKKLFSTLLLIPLLFLNGCWQPSPPVQHYILTAEAKSNQDLSHKKSVLLVGPVQTAPYLNQPQIIIRDSKNKITLATNHCWAGNLDEMIQGIIISNLRVLHPDTAVFSYPAIDSIKPEQRISIEILRFDSVPGKEAVINGRWSIFDHKKKTVVATQLLKISVPLTGKSYSDIASALSLALMLFSEKLNTEIMTL